MIHLLNGRGQLGRELQKLPLKECPEEVYIYHTWNVGDKSELVQAREYEKFQEFVAQYANKKIIFISTYSTQENWYNHYKQLAEACLLINCINGYIIRLPTLIGKPLDTGILQGFRNGETEAYGEMELISIQDAAMEIFRRVTYSGLVRSFRVKGEIASAKLVKELLRVFDTAL